MKTQTNQGIIQQGCHLLPITKTTLIIYKSSIILDQLSASRTTFLSHLTSNTFNNISLIHRYHIIIMSFISHSICSFSNDCQYKQTWGISSLSYLFSKGIDFTIFHFYDFIQYHHSAILQPLMTFFSKSVIKPIFKLTSSTPLWNIHNEPRISYILEPFSLVCNQFKYQLYDTKRKIPILMNQPSNAINPSNHIIH